MENSVVKKQPLVLNSKRTRPAGAGRECYVCKLCSEIEAVDTLVHKTKFENVMPLREVMRAVKDLTGLSVTLNQVLNHYTKHLPPDLDFEYKKQAQQLSNNPPHNINKKYKRSTIRFDAIEKLKEMYVDLSERLYSYRQTNDAFITSDNLKIYKDIMEELRKLAGDISKVELDREYMGGIILEVYKGLAEQLISSFSDLIRENLLKVEMNSEQKKEVLDSIKDDMTKVLEKGIDWLERDLKRRL